MATAFDDLRVRVVDWQAGWRREAARVRCGADGDRGRALAGTGSVAQAGLATRCRSHMRLAGAGRSQADLTLENPCTVDRDPWLTAASALSAGLSAPPLSLKKTVHASEQDRPDVAAARAQWKAEQPGLDATHLVFIDETGRPPHGAPLRTQPARPRCRAKSAWPLEVDNLHCRLARRRLDRAFVSTAPWMAQLLAYVEQVLARPGRRRYRTSASHHVDGARAIEARALRCASD